MTPYYAEDGITIYHGDCREVLPGLAHASLLIFDPPYNVGKKYDGYDDNLPPTAYAEWLGEVLTAAKADSLTWFPGALGALDLLPVLAATPWAFERLLAWHKKEYAGDMFGCGPARRGLTGVTTRSPDGRRRLGHRADRSRSVMAINPGEGVTPVDQVPAWVAQFPANERSGRGHVHVHVVDTQGQVVVNIGQAHGCFTVHEAERLAVALAAALGRLYANDPDAEQLAANLEKAVDGLGLTWPAGEAGR